MLTPGGTYSHEEILELREQVLCVIAEAGMSPASVQLVDGKLIACIDGRTYDVKVADDGYKLVPRRTK
jgi:hypothetical protein